MVSCHVLCLFIDMPESEPDAPVLGKRARKGDQAEAAETPEHPPEHPPQASDAVRDEEHSDDDDDVGPMPMTQDGSGSGVAKKKRKGARTLILRPVRTLSRSV
jgi:hypothetical protein